MAARNLELGAAGHLEFLGGGEVVARVHRHHVRRAIDHQHLARRDRLVPLGIVAPEARAS